MYISWAHYNIPKICGVLSFIVNPMFVYLLFTARCTMFGNYKFLLLGFALFNLVYSVFDVLVPIGIHEYRFSFIAFVIDGWFAELSNFNNNVLLIRCCLVSSCYSVLVSHFLYRYFLILRSSYTREHFTHFITFAISLFAAYFAIWAKVVKSIQPTTDFRIYLKRELRREFGADSMKVNMFSLMYNEGSPNTITQSYITVTILITMSGVSLLICAVLGFKIMSFLNSHGTALSYRTVCLQRRMLHALIIQTVIPTIVSFVPCFLAWLSPIFQINFGRTINLLGVISVAVFPFSDPLAIILCLPVLRNRFVYRRVKTRDQIPCVIYVSQNLTLSA